MMRTATRWLCLGAAMLSVAAFAATAQESVSNAPYAELRGLDRLSGTLTPYDVRVGETVRHGDLWITVSQCRYPTDNPSGDAFAYLQIRDERVADPVFEGWDGGVLAGPQCPRSHAL